MKLLAAFSFFTFFTAGLWAQNAELSGMVTDPTKAVVPGAEITMTRVAITMTRSDTTAEQKAVTNREGSYLLRALVPGIYEIQVRKAGFQTIVRTNVELHVGDRVQLNFELKVGDITQTTTVTDSPELLQTRDASVSTVVDRATVENIPLNGRSFQSLLGLAPGINLTNPNSGVSAGVAQGQFVVNGQRADANYFTVDGASANTGAGGPGGGVGQAGSGSLPGTTALGGFNGLASVDAIQEIHVSTSSFAPENGRTTGGQVSIVTRSGTNSYHGTVFNYFRNTILDANDWFLNSAGQARGAVRQNDFGGVFGGRIRKDKLFFFLSYEGLRLTNPQPATIPTFTEDARVLAKTAVNSTSPAYSGYMYQILNAYPLPTHDLSKGDGSTCMPVPLAQLGPNCIADFVGTFPSTAQLDAGSARIDYVLNSKTTFFGRYSHAPSTSSHTTQQPTSAEIFTTPAELVEAEAPWAATPRQSVSWTWSVRQSITICA